MDGKAVGSIGIFIRQDVYEKSGVLEKAGFTYEGTMRNKGEQTRAKIRSEAYKLFVEKGFKEVTMTDICERTRLSRGGLFRYYSGTAT